MLEIIKEAGNILKDLPELAIWILLGILVYKVIIVGSIFGIIKLAINKTHSAFLKEKVIKREINFGRHTFINAEAEEYMIGIIDRIIKQGDKPSYMYSHHYVHLSDLRKITIALDKMEAEDDNKN